MASIQYGTIISTRYDNGVLEAKVKLDGRSSGWLLVSSIVSKNFSINIPFGVGDMVSVVSKDKHSDGFVAGRFGFNGAKMSDKSSNDNLVLSFGDNYIDMNLINGNIDIDTNGTLNIKAKDIHIESDNFLLNASTKILKALSLDVGLTVKSLIKALGGCKGC